MTPVSLLRVASTAMEETRPTLSQHLIGWEGGVVMWLCRDMVIQGHEECVDLCAVRNVRSKKRVESRSALPTTPVT